MNKKIVILGGGTGMSILLGGLKNFPLDITAIVSVSDDGNSTGRLREEFNTPAVGDIRRVLISLSETEPLVEKLFNYRFKTCSDLDGHTIGNLILTGLKEITGNLSEGIEVLSKVFNLKGKVLPLTEDNAVLMAKMEDGSIVEGEHLITATPKKIKEIFYKSKMEVTPGVIDAILNADAIVLSMGSIYTSIIPNLINKSLIEAIDKSNAKIMYACNMVTQPGETDNFKVSDHVKLLNKYLGNKKIEYVFANNKEINEDILKKYQTTEQKDRVILDRDNLKDINLIENDYFVLVDNIVRHDSAKLAFDIFKEVFK